MSLICRGFDISLRTPIALPDDDLVEEPLRAAFSHEGFANYSALGGLLAIKKNETLRGLSHDILNPKVPFLVRLMSLFIIWKS